MLTSRSRWTALGLIVGSALLAVAFSTRDRWLVGFHADTHAEDHPASAEPPTLVKLSPQARLNLGLVAKPAALQSYWRTIQVPGVIIDRPGLSDRGIAAPAVGVVAQIHAFPGDTVQPGDRLFTLRLISEYLQNTQSELFKTTREIQLVKEQRDRLEASVKSGVIPEARLIELDNQLRRLTAAVQASRQDLLTRGLTPAQVAGVTEGKFVSEITVTAPAPLASPLPFIGQPLDAAPPTYEVQELKTDLGQQVQAGQLLGVLANHQHLYIEGHSFKREAPFLEQAAQQRWPLQVEFAEDDSKSWPPLPQSFTIRHLANTIDPASRTLDFYVPLVNQSRSYEKDGRTFLVWRYRPGQQVRLRVPVEEFQDVIVLPAAAVVREGPEAYVFRQNGDLFDRRPVHVLHEDRLHVVLANDGSVKPGMYLAQNAAASINRVLKAQSSSGGLPPGAHFHADGSLHIPGKE